LRFKPGILDEFFSAVDSIAADQIGVMFVDPSGSREAFKPIKKEPETKAHVST